MNELRLSDIIDDGRPMRENIVSNTSFVASELIRSTTFASMNQVRTYTTTNIIRFWLKQWSMCNIDHLFMGLSHSLFDVCSGILAFAAHLLDALLKSFILSSIVGKHTNERAMPFIADILG